MSSFIKNRLDDRALSAVQELLPIADGLGITPAQLALAWVLRRPEVASAIIGASRPEQVFDNVKASDIDLDAATIDAMDNALARVAITEPAPAPGYQPGVKHR